MKSYGIDFRGPVLIERLSSLPAHNPADKGRLVLNTTSNTVYISTLTSWVEVGAGGGGTITSVFGRGGPEITSVAGDYDADQVDYDNSASGLTSTDVQDAIDELDTAIDNIINPLLFKGAINANSDFPTSAEVQNGWTYRIQTDVTDNDPTKTNTGDSFLAGDEIAWNGTGWTSLGPSTFAASNVTYDNSSSGLTATDTQDAIDELSGAVGQASWIQTGVDLKSVAQTTVVTVPTGKRLVIDSLEVIIDTITGAAAMPTIRWGITGSEASILAAVALNAGMNSVDERESWDAAALLDTVLAASEVLQFGVTIAGTSTTHTATVIVRGILI